MSKKIIFCGVNPLMNIIFLSLFALANILIFRTLLIIYGHFCYPLLNCYSAAENRYYQ